MNKIAICITTRNRPEQFVKVEHAIEDFWPDDFDTRLFFVDDASDYDYVSIHPYTILKESEAFRFPNRVGISRAKNKAFEMAYAWGATDFIMLDDDCFPITKDWHLPYINSGINHLSYSFEAAYGSTYRRGKPKIEGNFKIHSIPNGCMCYYTRKCLDIVGGMDTQYNSFYEHIDLSRRIYNAGLTPYPYMDVVGSDKLFYSLDEHGEVERSHSDDERRALLQANKDYFYSQYNSKEFKEFRNG